MTERAFDTSFWIDGFIQKIDYSAKFLYIYLWTNSHCNPAGLYEISLRTIAFESGLAESELPKLFDILKIKVSRYPSEDLVWVKNFIHRQSRSSKFLAAAAKSLTTINSPQVISELLSYNSERYGISIPYQYYIDNLPIHARAADLSWSSSGSNSGSVSGQPSFSDSLFLKEIEAELKKLPLGVDSLAKHEAIKQSLSEIGIKKGCEVRSEYAIGARRIDLCWLKDRKVVAAFEIDTANPRIKTIEKLQALQCHDAFIILRVPSLRIIRYNEADYSAATASPGGDPKFDPVSLYEGTFGCSPSEQEIKEIRNMAEAYSVDWLIQAFEVGKQHGARTLRYIEAILKRYQAKGGPDADSGHDGNKSVPEPYMLRGIPEEEQ